MQCDDASKLSLVQRLPHAQSSWPAIFDCDPCRLSQLADGAWVGWWSLHQRIILGEHEVNYDLDKGIRLIDISSQYDFKWFDADTAAAAVVQKSIPVTVHHGEIARSLLGPHRVALLNTVRKIGIMSLAPESYAVRVRLSNIVASLSKDED